MAQIGDTFSPGEFVPNSGIYVCTQCGGGQIEFSTDVAGHRFPPSHHAGAKWRLKEKTPHRR